MMDPPTSDKLPLTFVLLLLSLALFAVLASTWRDRQDAAAVATSIAYATVKAEREAASMEVPTPTATIINTRIAARATSQATAAAATATTKVIRITATPARTVASIQTATVTKTPVSEDVALNSAEVPSATSTPRPTPTPTRPSANAKTDPCENKARFITDVTIKDGSLFEPGATFNKTWRFQNVGTCAWTTDYTYRHIDGPLPGTTDTIAVPYPVKPESYLDLTIQFTAPPSIGTYQSEWQLFDAAETPYEVSAYVLIEVVKSTAK